MDKPDLTALVVGALVTYVDPVGKQHPALVTAVWGDPATVVPCINIVYVSGDSDRQDSYGRQMERQSSLVHRSQNPAHGQYFMMPGDTPNPVAPVQV